MHKLGLRPHNHFRLMGKVHAPRLLLVCWPQRKIHHAHLGAFRVLSCGRNRQQWKSAQFGGGLPGHQLGIGAIPALGCRGGQRGGVRVQSVRCASFRASCATTYRAVAFAPTGYPLPLAPCRLQKRLHYRNLAGRQHLVSSASVWAHSCFVQSDPTVLGGRTLSTTLNTTYAFDGTSWSSMTSMPAARMRTAAAQYLSALHGELL